MKFSLNWISEFVEIIETPHQIADRLSAGGLEVEGVELLGQTLKGIVIGKIQAIHKHPNADKLQITEFFDGYTTHQIVTGAQNIFVGAIVPASLPGAVLANGTIIKPSELRGVDSFGMLCSQTELGLTSTSEGIWILPDTTPLGLDITEYYQLKDAILDISILPNRGDCQSILGVAREISVLTSQPLSGQKSIPLEAILQIRLTQAGFTLGNLPTDIANYVMLELGQPLEIHQENQTLTLSAPQYDPVEIRKSKPKLTPESLVRYEKGVDPTITQASLDRATELLQHFIPNATIKIAPTTPLSFTPNRVDYPTDKINRLLGLSLTKSEMDTLLECLGFKILETQVEVPAWRHYDIQEWPCLAEEIARLHGLDQIPTRLPARCITIEPTTPLAKLTQDLETLLPHLGAQQLNTLPMMDPEHLTDSTHAFTIQNPISPQQSAMRTSLLPNLLSVLSHNLHHGAEGLDAFEIGKTFTNLDGLVHEELHLGIITTLGPNLAPYTATETARNTLQFSDLKGRVEQIFDTTRTVQLTVGTLEDANYHPIQSAQILSGKTPVGSLGLLHPQLTKRYDITTPVGVIILNLSALVTCPSRPPKYQAFSKFPFSERDIALLVPKDLNFETITKTLQKNKSKYVKNIQLFDVYEDEKLGLDKKSLAIRLHYQDPEGTLTDDTINTAHNTLCQKLMELLPVTLR